MAVYLTPYRSAFTSVSPTAPSAISIFVLQRYGAGCPESGRPTSGFAALTSCFFLMVVRYRMTPMAEALRNGTPARDQKVTIERPDGSRVNVLVNIDPLYDNDGVLVGAVNCFQDISELTGLDTVKSPGP
jgi:hypothetical protein